MTQNRVERFHSGVLFSTDGGERVKFAGKRAIIRPENKGVKGNGCNGVVAISAVESRTVA